ncbi:hypothetical protein [Massilia genomosp. 1]|uniref:Uncharacterized protein n=1 Tax=Massilia genomosp. 1 TaxID=2609280 RepID=A0ABX0MJ24_9BURK|nr:hypothetical protein [Massilia genomosp. 1]NHZ62321.1 hypothetical protein [Massilia genomosp. 1]
MTTRQFPGLLKQTSAKRVWIRFNRILAWTLIGSPLLQWVLDAPFWLCLWIDLAMLLAHAGLSLALFGKPERKSRTFSVSMHVFGFSPWDLSARIEFLMTGYRIFLVLVGAGMIVPLIAVLAYRIARVDLFFGPAMFWVLMAYCAPISFMAIFVLLHIHAAARQAGRRWGFNGAGLAAVALLSFCVPAIVHTFN